MAITKTVVDVNNGQYGAATGGNNPWTKSDVLDALETVFQTLGMNGGTQTNGIPVTVEAPGTFSYNYTDSAKITNNSDFDKCGGVGPTFMNNKSRYFNVINNPTNTAYRMLEEFRFIASQVNTSTNEITIVRHGLSTNDEVTYAAGQSTADGRKIPELNLGGHYFVIKVDDDTIKLSDTSGGSEKPITAPTQNGYYLQHKDSSAYDNFTINVLKGDVLYFDSSGASGAGGTFNLIRNHNSYDASKLLFRNSTWASSPTGNGTVNTVWSTYDYAQTESEALFPDRGVAETGTDLDDPTDSYGIHKYMYANSVNPDMKGEIVILPSLISQTTNSRPYWKYTVPANNSTGRSELKLRVYRNLTDSSTGATIASITIHSIGSGWSDGDSFTILGTAIGGASPANDLTFGTNTPHNNGTNGIPSIKVTNLGAGANFYQKSTSGKFAIAKVVHDAGKTFGTTYYGFGMSESNNNKLVITSGSGWRFINHRGIHSTSTEEDTIDFGRYNGLQGLDYMNNKKFVSRQTAYTSNERVLTYASTNTPTSYKLQINIYRDNADTDFAVIQFVQTIDNDFVPFATFSISRGTQHGSGIYDLDYVFQDSLLHFYTITRGIGMSYGNTQFDSYEYGVNEPVGQNSKARAASYGYLRNSTNNTSKRNFTTEFVNNINTDSLHNSDNVITYYRDATFDQHNNKSVNSSADFYKPIKGIPVANGIMPVPYYLPDDFAMLQVATTPDQVTFRTGDTITISGTEVYEIVLASFEQQQTGLDGNSSGTTIGMLFLARTT